MLLSLQDILKLPEKEQNSILLTLDHFIKSAKISLLFSFNSLKINYSFKRKNNVLFSGRTKSMTEKITEGQAAEQNKIQGLFAFSAKKLDFVLCGFRACWSASSTYLHNAPRHLKQEQ